MFVVHFYENNVSLLSQALTRIPTVDENIKIKGRKGKVVNVIQVDENKYNVQVTLEKIVKNQPVLKDDKKKKR